MEPGRFLSPCLRSWPFYIIICVALHVYVAGRFILSIVGPSIFTELAVLHYHLRGPPCLWSLWPFLFFTPFLLLSFMWNLQFKELVAVFIVIYVGPPN